MPAAPRASKEAPAADTTNREVITERGAPLLQLIHDAEQDENNEEGGLRLTQDEAHEALAAGHIAVDNETVDADNTLVATLTPAGEAVLTTGADGQPAVAGSGAPATGGFKITMDIPVPTDVVKRRTSESNYPFATMPLNSSFHVPKSEDNPDPVLRLSSSVSVARSRFSEVDPSGETETVTKHTYKRGENGKGFAKGPDGKRVILETKDVVQPKRILTKDFLVQEAKPNDPEGPGARVWRVK